MKSFFIKHLTSQYGHCTRLLLENRQYPQTHVHSSGHQTCHTIHVCSAIALMQCQIGPWWVLIGILSLLSVLESIGLVEDSRRHCLIVHVDRSPLMQVKHGCEIFTPSRRLNILPGFTSKLNYCIPVHSHTLEWSTNSIICGRNK